MCFCSTLEARQEYGGGQRRCRGGIQGGGQVNEVSLSQGTPQKRALILFAGKGSMGADLASRGFVVVSVDRHPGRGATHPVDILGWNYRDEYPRGYFDVIIAAPPGRCVNQAVSSTERDPANVLVNKVLDIVEFFEPAHWFLLLSRHA